MNSSIGRLLWNQAGGAQERSGLSWMMGSPQALEKRSTKGRRTNGCSGVCYSWKKLATGVGGGHRILKGKGLGRMKGKGPGSREGTDKMVGSRLWPCCKGRPS